MEMLKGAISLCVKIHDMYGTFTSNKEQCNWLLANVNSIMTVLKVQLERNAFPRALEGPLVVLQEDLRASVAVLENFGCCSDFKRFVFGSKHASLFAKAGDHLYHSYNTFCHSLSIHLVLDERDAGSRRWQVFEEAYQRDVKECEQDLGVAMLNLDVSAQLQDHGVSSRAAMCCLPFPAVAPSAPAAEITTLEEAQGCSWYMRAEELKMEYKEIKKGQPMKEIRLGKSGSFGDVFSAVHCGSTLVAVKKLRCPGKAEELACSDLARVSFAAFVAEVSFAFSLNHPNIVRTIGGVVDALEEPPCWIVMERLQRSLAEMPVDADGKLLLNEFEKLDIIMGICSALVYLHSSNRDGSEPTEAHAHCDLKPENIMYQDGMVKLIDFGIARVSIRSTYGSSVKGTHNWMSPEQCVVAARKTYTLCDMFSFGLIVKWILVGAREDVPFKDAHIEYIREQHARLFNSSGCMLHPYVEDLSLVPPVFRLLIRFCTATDSGKRWTAPKAMWELHELKLRLAIAEEGQLIPSPNFLHNAALKYRHDQSSLQSLAQAAAASWTSLPPVGLISPGAANPSEQPQTLPVSDTSSSKWRSLLEQMQAALKPEVVASIAYHRNVVFAATLCDEFSDADAAGGALADAAHYAAASKTLNIIATSLENPTSAEVMSSLLAKVRSTIPYIEAAYGVAKSDKDYPKAAELQNLMASLRELLLKAETLLQEHPAWPCVNALQKFSLSLQRYTTHMVFTKKWFRRFFVMQNGHLYYSDGKNEYADSREGSASFANRNPTPDGRYCVNLRGCTVIPCSAPFDGEAFAFEIKPKFPSGDKVPRSVFLAATDDITRQRCIRVIQAASVAGPLQNIALRDIASVVALPRDLLCTKSAACVRAVFAALGATPNDQSVKAAGFDLPSLKIAGFDLAAFRAAGCDWATIKSYGFTATEVKAAGCDFNGARAAGFDLPSLRAGGFDITAFRAVGLDWAAIKTAGFRALEAKAAGCDAATAKSVGYSEWSLLCSYVLEFNEAPAVVAALQNHSDHSKQSIMCVAFHSSEPILATSTGEGSVMVWRLLGSTGTEPVCVLTQRDEHKYSFIQQKGSNGYPDSWYHTKSVTSVAFHQSEPILATCGSKTAKLWRLDWSVYDITASLIVELNLDYYNYSSAVFHPIAPILTTLSYSGGISAVTLWQMKSDWSASSSFEKLPRPGPVGSASFDMFFVTWHPSGQLLATCSYDSLKLWRLHESKPTTCVTTIQGHSVHAGEQQHIACVSFHPKLPIFVTGSSDSTAKLWHLNPDGFVPSCIATLHGHKGSVTSVAFHPFVPLLATGSNDCSAKLWLLNSDGDAAACVATLERAERNPESKDSSIRTGHQNGIKCITFHPSLPILATCDNVTGMLWR